jgi:predicted nucleic acid-binding protein
MIVLDANILIRAVLGRRVRQLIDTYAGQGVRFFAPDVAFDDAEKYLLSPLEKAGQARRRPFGIARILVRPIVLEALRCSR